MTRPDSTTRPPRTAFVIECDAFDGGCMEDHFIGHEAETTAPDAGLRAARFVLDYWLTEYLRALREQPNGMWGIGTHPLALVQAAMDGETNPAELGLPADLHEAFRKHIALAAHPDPLSEGNQDAGGIPRGPWDDDDWSDHVASVPENWR